MLVKRPCISAIVTLVEFFHGKKLANAASNSYNPAPLPRSGRFWPRELDSTGKRNKSAGPQHNVTSTYQVALYPERMQASMLDKRLSNQSDNQSECE